MEVTVGQTQTLRVKDQSVRGVELIAVVQHDTLNTGFATHEVDWSNVIVSVVLKRGKRDYVIYKDQATPGILASAFSKTAFKYAHPLHNTNWVELNTEGVADYNKLLLPCYIDFGGIINVKNSDVLAIKVQLNSGGFGADIDTAASFIEFYPVEDVGNEFLIPQVITQSIQAGQGRVREDLGENVVGCYWINIDKADLDEGNKTIEQMSVVSDKLTTDYNYNQLINKTIAKFEDASEAQARKQSFVIVEEDVPLDDFRIDATLTSANITAGKNWLVAFGGVTESETVRRYFARQRKHAEKNIRKLNSKVGKVELKAD